MRRVFGVTGLALLLMAADATPAPPPAPAPAPALVTAEATGVLSRMVHDADGVDIGRIVDVVVDPSGKPRAIVIDVGGFMGVGSRRVAVDWKSAHIPPPGAPEKGVSIDLTDQQIRSAPDYTDRSKPATIVGPPPAPSTPPAPATK